MEEAEPLLGGAGLCAVVGNFWPMQCWVHLTPSVSRHAPESHSHLHLSQLQLPLPHPPIGSSQAATGFNEKLMPEEGEREGVYSLLFVGLVELASGELEEGKLLLDGD